MRGGVKFGKESSLELARISREHDLAQFGAFGKFFGGWANAQSDLLVGLEDMRRGAESLRAQNVLVFDGLVKIALATAEAEAGDPDRALSVLGEALATAGRLDFRAFEAELHRARGEMLLKRDPGNAAPAEEAFQSAIVVAKRKGTRSFELRAALSLAKLYQTIGRSVEAHAVLAPAVERLLPTTEMSEIPEAQALVAMLNETDRAAAHRGGVG
jgi:predicted ATPase